VLHTVHIHQREMPVWLLYATDLVEKLLPEGEIDLKLRLHPTKISLLIRHPVVTVRVQLQVVVEKQLARTEADDVVG